VVVAAWAALILAVLAWADGAVLALLVLREWDSPVQAGSLVQAGLLGRGNWSGNRWAGNWNRGYWRGGRWWPWGVGAGVALAAATWPYYGGYGYGYDSCVQWVPDYGWVNVCSNPY
jgi:hypothetical protein